MSMGLGQHAGEFASPDFPDFGIATWDQMSGLDVDHPYVGGPVVGGFSPDSEGTGLVRMAAGDTPAEISGVQHWSELLNWRESPLPYFLGLSLLFFGLLSLQVHARVGR